MNTQEIYDHARKGDGYIGLTETAFLVRKALKENFPGVKFSVKTSRFSMGTSIDIAWIDGPTTASVREVAEYPYQSGGFDGMTDSTTTTYHWLLPDGTSVIERCGIGGYGTERNLNPNPPRLDAILVHHGAKYVSCQRTRTPEHFERIAEILKISTASPMSYEDERFVWKTYENTDFTNGFPATITTQDGWVYDVKTGEVHEAVAA